MSKDRVDAWKSVFRLARFLFWYTAVAAALLVLLPWAGLELQERYEALSTAVRMYSIGGLLVAIAAWQLLSVRGRLKSSRAGQSEGSKHAV